MAKKTKKTIMPEGVILTAPNTQCLREGASAVGFEYAVRRDKDKRYLSEPDEYGEGVWETDSESGTWRGSAEDAYNLANRYDLLNPDCEEDTLIDGYHVVARPWFHDEDLIDSEEDMPFDKLDFSGLGITPDDFEE
ncbi:hypothetical protein [Bifidobacterium parmae]|uniref:Uncharacterized protein n=1 Tax=Bifidobacterium parmae TaxID=361854 RepID=A0A2N5J4R7_9BIFI|nr:hypothetical protein [Bifidobacterium parmae]PLS29177.1 hypothetical protein Uis4E_0755 [Bifidobacterium parmae]